MIDSEDPILISNLELLSGEVKSARVILERSSERNPGGTRNIGIDNASGQWICFWDCDDFGIAEEMIQTIEMSERMGCNLSVGKYQRIVESQPEKIKYNKKTIDLERNLYVNPGLWRIAIRKELIGNTRFLNIKMGEDQVFLFTLLQKIPNIHFSDKIVYKYVRYAKNQLTSDSFACNDIEFALKETAQMYIVNPSINLLIGFYRQFITAMKLGNTGVIKRVFALLLHLTKKKPITLIYAPYSLQYILRNRLK